MQIFSIIVFIFTILANWSIYSKMGREGWESLIPVYNQYVMFEVLYGNGWRFLLILVPFYNIYVYIQYSIDLAHAFGKKTAFAIGLIFLPGIFWIILAIDDSIFIGSNKGVGSSNVAGNNYIVNNGNAVKNEQILVAAPPVPLPSAIAADIPVCIIDVPSGRKCASFGISSNGNPCTIGRSRESDVILNADDQALSRRHFTLLCSNGTYFISDAGSSHGTYLNGVPLMGWAPINSRDRIRAGGKEYYILFGLDSYRGA